MGENKPGAAKIASNASRVKEVKPPSNPRRGRKLSTASKPSKKSKSIGTQPPDPEQQVSSRKTKPKTKPKSKAPKVKRNSKGQFPSGVSGNPGGRKVGQLTLTGVLRNLLEKESGKKNCETVGEEIMRELLRYARKGSPKLFELIMNRIDGKQLEKVLQLDAYTPLKQASEADIKKALKAARESEREGPDGQ